MKMNKKSIQMIKQMFDDHQIDDQLLTMLRLDKRKGVEKIVKQYDKQQEKVASQMRIYEKKWKFENECRLQDNDLIAGVDEAGRGPLAGPVVAAAVILPKDFQLIGLTDSKQLTELERNDFFELIKEQAISYHISMVDNETIDQLNILESTRAAMEEPLIEFTPLPHIGLIDAVTLHNLPFST